MKKIYFVAVLALVSICAMANGPRAIGVNLGADLGVNYQHSFGTSNMLDVSAYFNPVYPVGNAGSAAATVTYDWINPGGLDVPWTHAGDWNWYAGVGAAGGVNSLFNTEVRPGWFFGAAGHIGIEYIINHFAVSLDARPAVGVWAGYDQQDNSYWAFNPWGLVNGLSLGLKYSF